MTLGIISRILAIFGGTIIGFAAINTIGNAIAGLIVMTSRPFEVGDRAHPYSLSNSKMNTRNTEIPR